MKKFLSALALLLVVAGCSNAPAENGNSSEEDQSAAITTLDAATFAKELESTETVKFYVNDPEDTSVTLAEGEFDADTADAKKEVADTISSLDLKEADDQKKVYGTPLFIVDLNAVSAPNYARFAVFEDVVVIQTKDKFVNYTLDDASEEAINTLTDSLVATFAPEEE